MKKEKLLEVINDIIDDMNTDELKEISDTVLKALGRITIDKCEPKLKPKKANNEEVIAFVDGSFDKGKGLCGSGIVILRNVKSDIPFKEIKFSTKDKYNQWNIQGECEAALESIRWAISEGYNKIAIYYDYQGIGSWANREWKAKNDYTKSYVQKFDELNRHIEIDFVKVKGHSKNKWNDWADKLARESLGK